MHYFELIRGLGVNASRFASPLTAQKATESDTGSSPGSNPPIYSEHCLE
jgi:hypothetical protein